jgi:uncharacterized protein (DUF1330 family)
MMNRKTVLTCLGAAVLLGIGYAAGAADAPSAKAYLLAEINVTDQRAYAPYAAQTPPILAKYGGHYLVRGGRTESLEGPAPAPRVAVIEFPSMAAAQGYYRSAEYQKIVPVRQSGSTGRLFLVEGTAPAP